MTSFKELLSCLSSFAFQKKNVTLFSDIQIKINSKFTQLNLKQNKSNCINFRIPHILFQEFEENSEHTEDTLHCPSPVRKKNFIK